MVSLDRLPELLEHELSVAFPDRRLLGAWLYGSHARGRNRADSDLDIAVLFDAPLEPVATFDAAARLASVTGASVDLVDLRRAGGRRCRRSFVPDDVVMQKLASIDRCLRSIRDYLAGDFVDLCRELSTVS